MNKPFVNVLSTLLCLTLLPLVSFAQNLSLRPDNIDEIVLALTLEEKVHMITGSGTGWSDPDVRFPGIAGWTYAVPRLGIPSVYLADGPHGVNMTRYRDFDHFDYACTTTPTSTAMAATFSTEAIGRMGDLIGDELKERGLDVILGPAINLQRTMLGGRDQEYMSEDPLLTGKMAAAYIKAVQAHQVGTSLKHFAANNAETRRKGSDSRVSPRALRELYLKGFEIAVKEAQPWTVMTSYNYINGIHTTERRDLVTDILRDEWGFKGIVITDWDGGYLPVEITKAGTDIIEPGSDAARKELSEAAESGALDIALVDKAVRRILEFTVKCPSYKQYAPSNDIHRDAHLQTVREVGAEGMVLLKNDGTLPLKPGQIALYGCTSYDLIAGNMGVGGTNGGAWHVSLVEALRKARFGIDMNLLRQHTDWIGREKGRIQQAMAADPVRAMLARPDRPEELIPQETVTVEEDPRIAQARAMNLNFNVEALLGTPRVPTTIGEQVAANEVAVITLGRTTGEGFDRNYREFELRDSERELIDVVSKAYHAAGKKVVVLLNVCAAIETRSWADEVDAILNVWEPGMAAGFSIVDVLTGAVNPSGRLPQTWALHYGDQPADRNFPSDYNSFNMMEHLGKAKLVENPVKGIDLIDYEEGVYMGYRYFTTFGQEVAYPFGFGLSYTQFAWSNPVLTPSGDGFSVEVTVTNTGTRSGKEVVELYVNAPKGGLDKPVRELKAFAKTRELTPGASETLRMSVSAYDLASFNEKVSAWQTAKGTYAVQLCRDANTVVSSVPFKVTKALAWPAHRALLLQSELKEIKPAK